MRRLAACSRSLAPLALVAATAIVGSFFERSTEIYFINALVAVSIVVALYVFVGNSGVLSFGHIAFVAVGSWTAGVLSVPVEEKPATMPNLFGFLSDTTVGNIPSLLLAALVGGLFALLAGLPLMRLSGLAAGIATFAVLEITNNILRYYERMGPGLNVFSSVPETTDMQQAAIGAIVAIVVAFLYQASRFGRQLRAARDDAPAARAVGISVYLQRLIAFALSGALAGFAGGLYVHFLPINADFVYLDLTFITLAMLVIGGMTSLWGAVVGALAVSGPRLAARGGRERPRRRRSPVGEPARRGWRPDGDRADPAALRHHRRQGDPAAPVARLGRRRKDRHESLRRRVRGRGLPVRGQPRHARRRRGVGVRSEQAHIDAIKKNGLQLTGAGDVIGHPHATADPRELPPCDFGIVATKAMHADAADRGDCARVRRRRRRVGDERRRQRGDARRDTSSGSSAARRSPRASCSSPGVVQWDVKGDTTFGPFEPRPLPRLGDRAAGRGLYARRDADARRRRRAARPMAKGHLQRGDEPDRRADRPHTWPCLRAARSSRARLGARRRGQGGGRGAGHRARRRPGGAHRPRGAAGRRLRAQGVDAPGRRGPACDRDRLSERRHRAASGGSSACRRRSTTRCPH